MLIHLCVSNLSTCEPGLQFAGIGSLEDIAQSLDPQHFHLLGP